MVAIIKHPINSPPFIFSLCPFMTLKRKLLPNIVVGGGDQLIDTVHGRYGWLSLRVERDLRSLDTTRGPGVVSLSTGEDQKV